MGPLRSWRYFRLSVLKNIFFRNNRVTHYYNNATYFDLNESHHFFPVHKSTHINAAVHLPTTQFVSKRQKLYWTYVQKTTCYKCDDRNDARGIILYYYKGTIKY